MYEASASISNRILIDENIIVFAISPVGLSQAAVLIWCARIGTYFLVRNDLSDVIDKVLNLLWGYVAYKDKTICRILKDHFGVAVFGVFGNVLL